MTPLFLEVARGHLNLRVCSMLREVPRGGGRITSEEPEHVSDRFVLRGPGGVEASSIQTSASGGPFRDHFDIVFDWSGSAPDAGRWVLQYGEHQTVFATRGWTGD